MKLVDNWESYSDKEKRIFVSSNSAAVFVLLVYSLFVYKDKIKIKNDNLRTMTLFSPLIPIVVAIIVLSTVG